MDRQENMLPALAELEKKYCALKKKLSRYEIILAQTENVLFEWDYHADVFAVSDTWQGIFGFCPATGTGREILTDETLFHPEDIPVLLDRMNNLEGGSPYEAAEVRIATAEGRYLWCRIRATAIRDSLGHLEKVAGIIINIDAEKRAEQMLQERANRDPLTKLLNKTAARKRVEEYLRRYPEGVDCALLIIDLDHFKQINDRYGHLFGDTVLSRTAREIGRLFRSQDIVARIGGDEFLVLMRGVSNRRLVENRCLQLKLALHAVLQEVSEILSCSIGAALSPMHGKTYVELFQRADRALYCAKNRGRDTYVIDFDEESLRTRRETAVSSCIDSDDQPEWTDTRIFRYIFQQLFASRDMDTAIGDLLKLLGTQTNVSRVYIFENSRDNRTCSNTYEWCNQGIISERQNLQNVSYETDIPDFDRNFDESDIFYCPDIRTLPQNLYKILHSQGIKSILHCAIRENGVFRGYIGFDDCREYRMWTKEQIRLLKDFSGMLSLFLLRQRRQENIQQWAAEIQSALDGLNAWVYIADPDTCEIRYLNAVVQRESAAQLGMPCYRALMGREERCPGCPAAGIRERKNGRAILRVPGFSGPILSEASLICWKGRDACLMTCREIPENVKTVTEAEMDL